MGKKNKNKPKKVNVKRERYKKFHKEKPGTLDITMPEPDDEMMKQRKEDEETVGRFMKFRPRYKPRMNIVKEKEFLRSRGKK